MMRKKNGTVLIPFTQSKNNAKSTGSIYEQFVYNCKSFVLNEVLEEEKLLKFAQNFQTLFLKKFMFQYFKHIFLELLNVYLLCMLFFLVFFQENF